MQGLRGRYASANPGLPLSHVNGRHFLVSNPRRDDMIRRPMSDDWRGLPRLRKIGLPESTAQRKLAHGLPQKRLFLQSLRSPRPRLPPETREALGRTPTLES